jgi:hypothetical protein
MKVLRIVPLSRNAGGGADERTIGGGGGFVVVNCGVDTVSDRQ